MKFLTMLILVTGIVLIFNLGGITTNSGNLISGFLDEGFSYFTSSEFWNVSCSNFSTCTSNIPLMLGLGVLSGVVASLFGRSPDPTYILGGVAASLMTILVFEMGALWAVISPSVDGWMKDFINLVMLSLTLGLVVSGISWWRGADG